MTDSVRSVAFFTHGQCGAYLYHACAVHHERYLLLKCRMGGSAVQSVRHRRPARFIPAKATMQLFIWQPGILQVVHFIMDSVNLLGAAP